MPRLPIEMGRNDALSFIRARDLLAQPDDMSTRDVSNEAGLGGSATGVRSFDLHAHLNKSRVIYNIRVIDSSLRHIPADETEDETVPDPEPHESLAPEQSENRESLEQVIDAGEKVCWPNLLTMTQSLPTQAWTN